MNEFFTIHPGALRGKKSVGQWRKGWTPWGYGGGVRVSYFSLGSQKLRNFEFFRDITL